MFAVAVPLIFVLGIALAWIFAWTRISGQSVAPMAAGWVIGVLVWRTLVGIVSADMLKVGLGLILICSAVRVFRPTGK